MAQFTQNPKRLDPYKNFKFRVTIDNVVVAGVSKVGALKRTTEVVKHRDGGDFSSSRKSPGRTEYEAITLERGVTHDKNFQNWARAAQEFNVVGSSEAQMGLGNFRKDIQISLYNESGQKVLTYNVYRCWVSEYQALADLDANANAVNLEHVKIENEGWELDEGVTEPKEPDIAPR
jgi:phage tail-like protein